MTRRKLAILMFSLLLSPLTGCQNPPVATHETFTRNSPYAVLDTPRLLQLKAEAPPPPPERAWWTARNDDRLSVNNGYREAEIIDYEIRVRDYQRSRPGRIDDHVDRTIRSTRYGRIVR